MKFRNILFTVALIIVPTISLAADSIGFADVPANHPNYRAISYLTSKGIINGYPDGLFRPNREINRAEAIKVLLMAKETTIKNVYSEKFYDVKRGMWFFPYVMEAKQQEIISGYNDNSFKPDQSITKAESIKIVLSAFDNNIFKLRSKQPIFADVPYNIWYSKFFKRAKDRRIIMPDDYQNVYPLQNMNRAEFAEIVYRMVILKNTSEFKFRLSLSAPLVEDETTGLKVNLPNQFTKYNMAPYTMYIKQDQTKPFETFRFTTPNSALIIMHIDNNDRRYSKTQYFSEIEKYNRNVLKDFNRAYSQTTINGYPVLIAKTRTLDENIQDYYMYLPNKKVAIIHSSYGRQGSIESELKYLIEDTVKSIKFDQSLYNKGQKEINSNIPSLARSNILIEGMGAETLLLFDDAVIIETDVIGRGNGPVDYYYSSKFDLTIKLDRNLDVILDIQEGKTSAF